MKKYEFTGAVQNGLRQIRALISFGNVNAGDLGAWIESEKNLSHEDAAAIAMAKICIKSIK
jgi:hypothetical protein